ncbi:heavy metal-associated isoprenylated plant protein 24-like [Impatiens glandulifera]|uniref:heavy metal-associated isoprenylated plant protein 24-like n=1 Tax=Impatiens glandulifera TaxID=253017 RepID=UPI001FB10126|nr:heavy metal-associated isoprenylated plant protein 24-like [Impatiens glandulifera]
MGISGMLKYLSKLLRSVKKRKKFKHTRTSVSLKIRMDCNGCVRKVKKALSRVKGVKSVEVNLKEQKATVIGYVDPKKVMAAAKKTGKKVEAWPYVPYNLVAHPYMTQVYDKKAPPGFVRATNDISIARLNSNEEQYINMFSDENPNASCSIM